MGNHTHASSKVSTGQVPAASPTFAPVRATARLKSRVSDVLVLRTGTILRAGSPNGEEVENMMRQIPLICVALSLGVFVSPASAQQTAPEQAAPPAQQTGPNEPASPTEQSMPEEAQPPSTPQAEPLPPPPPPFPPMPRARPSHRWVDLGEKHKSRAHRRSARTHRQHTNKQRRAAQPTSRMTRRCLNMSLRQAMRQTTCRSLMQHNLHASAPRHHHSAHRHNAVHHRHRHQAKRRRT